MKAQRRIIVLVATLLFMAPGLTACDRQGSSDPTALHYTLPTRMIIDAGQFLPGTTLQYVGETDKGAQVLIDGQQASKKVGDSLNWHGVPMPGTDVSLALRVLSYGPESLQVVGTAEVDVTGVQPQATDAVKTAPITYSGVVAYHVPKGDAVPGSTIVYVGRTENGAELGGITGYPYRKAGDSISWEGTLREGLYISLELRVVQYDENNLNVAGVATLWFGA